MRKVKSLLKQTTPLQICSAPFLNSPELWKQASDLSLSNAKMLDEINEDYVKDHGLDS